MSRVRTHSTFRVSHLFLFKVYFILINFNIIFFQRIFIEHKELKPLWRFSKGLDTVEQMNANQMLKKHGEKLFNALDMAVNSLDDLETLVPILIQLGYSHYTWGVRDKHFVVNKLFI